MAIEIDGVLKEWGDRLYYLRTQARPPGRSITGFRASPAVTRPPKEVAAAAVRAAIGRTVRRVPEVMVKITRGRIDPSTGKPRLPCRDMRSIKKHFDYISRNGQVALEDERGDQILGKQAVKELCSDWQMGGVKAIPKDSGYRREAFNIILSMPAGTDRAQVKEAARAFAHEIFLNHQFVFAAHEDEDHPHVHLCVKAVSRDLVRLNPRKQDLQCWRECFAEQLRQRGVEANATPRTPRGQVRKAQHQALRRIDREFQQKRRLASSRVTQKRREEILAAVDAGETSHPAEARVSQRRAFVIQGFGEMARALAASPEPLDRSLAVQIVEHVRQFPAPKTQNRIAIEAEQARGRGHGPSGPARGR